MQSDGEIISKKRFAAQLFYLLPGNGDIQPTECVIASRLQMHCVTEGTCGPLIIITPLLQSLLPFEITLSTAVAQISLKVFLFRTYIDTHRHRHRYRHRVVLWRLAFV